MRHRSYFLSSSEDFKTKELSHTDLSAISAKADFHLGVNRSETVNQAVTNGAEIAHVAGMKPPKNNKALVREAFDTLFNRRNYVKAAEFWSPNYSITALQQING